MYLTFEEYQEMGGGLDRNTFNNLEYAAGALIDYYTFNRLDNETEYPEAVKRCVYALIDLEYAKRQATSLGVDSDGNTTAAVSSQSNDGVSISYNVMSAVQAFETAEKQTKNIITMYLQGVKNSLGRKLLYRGLYPGE